MKQAKAVMYIYAIAYILSVVFATGGIPFLPIVIVFGTVVLSRFLVKNKELAEENRMFI